MSKILELKYDIGDVAYTMLGDKPFKVEVVNFNLNFDRKLPIGERVEYVVERHPLVENIRISLTYFNTSTTYKKLNELFDTKEELIESLIKKIKDL